MAPQRGYTAPYDTERAAAAAPEPPASAASAARWLTVLSASMYEARELVVLRSGALLAQSLTLAEARELRRRSKEAEAAALALKRALASLKYNLGD